MSADRRRGFTLVELLVVVVLGGFIVLATYQVLITNSRIDAVNNARIQGQQNLRAGLAVLFGELREISPAQGDLLAMESDSVTFRAQRAYGLACSVDYTRSPPEVNAFQIGPVFEAGDSVFVLHDNDTLISNDDAWHVGTVRSVDTSATCGGFPSQVLQLPFIATTAAAASPDTVRIGAPVRAFDVYTYGLYTIDGEPYLARRLSTSSDPAPLVGPLLPNHGLTLRYMDTLGAVTAVDTLVSQIEVIIRYQSRVRNAQNNLVADSIVARIYPRN